LTNPDIRGTDVLIRRVLAVVAIALGLGLSAGVSVAAAAAPAAHHAVHAAASHARVMSANDTHDWWW